MKSNVLLKVWGIILTVAILSGLLMVSVPASAGNLTWSRGSYPSAYNAATAPTGILSANNNNRLLAISADGKTLYSYNTNAAPNIIGKSTDGGVTFTNSALGVTLGLGLATAVPALGVPTIVDMAPDASTVIITDGANIYGSTDGGVNFSIIGLPAGWAGAITSLDIAAGPTILIGGTAMYAIYKSVGGFGGGWTLVTTMRDTAATQAPAAAAAFVATEVIYKVAFSPNYATDGLFVVVSNDNIAATGTTYVRFGYANSTQTLPLGQQYATVKLNNVATPVTDNGVAAASVAFPSDFDISANANLLVGINSTGATAGVWKIAVNSYSGVAGVAAGARRIATTPALSIALVGTWTAGTAYEVDATVGGTNPITYITGVSAASNTSSFSSPAKSYTGLFGAVYASNADSKAFVMGNGASAGLSVSTDSGVTFNQINYITAPNIAFNQVNMIDATNMFILIGTAGANSNSVLKYSNSAWQRVYYNAAETLVRLYVSPTFATDNTLYITTTTSTVYKSVNGGSTFSQFVTNGPGPVVDMAVVDATNFFYITAGSVFKSSAMFTALTFPAGATFASIKYVSPTLIYIGGTDGKVYKSVDGLTFAAVGAVAPFAAGHSVYIGANATDLYAGGFTAGDGVKVWKTATSTWVNYGTAVGAAGGLLATATINSVDLTSAGVVYAFDTTAAPANVFRIADGVHWENLGFAPTGAAFGFKLLANVYAFATNGIQSYTDTLAVVPTFTTPATGTTPLLDKNVATIGWNAVAGNDSANNTYYTYWVSTTSDIASGVVWGPLNTATTNAFLGAAGLINGLTYYVQVQAYTAPTMAGAPVSYSKKSAIGSFATKLTQSGNNPGAVSGMAPAAGGTVAIAAGQTSASPAFQWAAVANATSYEIKISSKSDFSDVIDSSVGLTSTVYQTPVKLAAGTYYWELRAVAGTNQGDWIQSVFTVVAPANAAPTVTSAPAPVVTPTFIIPTQPAPVVNVTVPTPTNSNSSNATPAWAWVVIAIAAVLVIAVIVLIARTRRV